MFHRWTGAGLRCRVPVVHDAFRTCSVSACAQVSGRSNKKQLPTLDRIVLALETFKLVNRMPMGANFSVPQSFVVPCDTLEWPEFLWDMKLGIIAKNLIAGVGYPSNYSTRCRLLGLMCTTEVKVQNIITAIQVFKKVNDIPTDGRVIIPYAFVVPKKSSEWPHHLWGMKLGFIINNVLNNGSFGAYRDLFQSVGLFPRKDDCVERLLIAVEAYIKFNKLNKLMPGGPVVISPTFKIPANSMLWPELVRGMHLGYRIQEMYHKNLYAGHRSAFESLGLRSWDAEVAQNLLEGIQTYRRLYKIPEGEAVDIPRGFVVPDTDEWPEALWDVKLGREVRQVIYKDALPQYTKQFEEVGIFRHVKEERRSGETEEGLESVAAED
jgi:hypothetical protein